MSEFCTDPNAPVADMSLWEALTPCPQLATTVPALIAVQLVLIFIFAYTRKYAMYKAGLSPKDIELIYSPRQNKMDNEINKDVSIHTDSSPISSSSSLDEQPTTDPEAQDQTIENNQESATTELEFFDLPTLIEKYGDRKLRILDSVPRKTLHFLLIGLGILQLQFTTTTFVTQGQTAILSTGIQSLVILFFNFWFRDSWFATHLFGSAARIRDGKVARGNICVAYTLGWVGILACYMISFVGIIPQLEDPSLQLLILVLYYTPVAVGDAMGELVGGPFGGTFFNTFAVKGFGEINRKSVEGCFAVFLGSLGGCLTMCFLYGATTSSWLVLCGVMAVVTTIVETAAFRSTDNLFIPVFNCLVVLMALGPFGSSFNQ